jgi:D-mannonate dehydratase
MNTLEKRKTVIERFYLALHCVYRSFISDKILLYKSTKKRSVDNLLNVFYSIA